MKMNLLQTCVLISFVIVVYALDEERKVFIAYMGSLPEGEYSPSSHHYDILKQITNPSKSLIRSYHRSFNGFAAYLSQEEQQKLARIDGIVSVFPCQKMSLQTTRSWDFMRFPTTVERSPAGGESDIIVAVIDTGIWPELENFNDEGLGPVPKKWKGECRGGTNFTCNRKIIGARSYGLEDSVRDTNGHGTHVASIIAGKQVHKANYYDLAQGIARGGVPSARLAIYKACDVHCEFIDILNAFDDAISDGVDIISISVGHGLSFKITSDPITIGAFHAIQNGVLTVNAAGNDGPSLYSVTGDAPWSMSVAASNIDRIIVNKVHLGDGTDLVGTFINAFPSSHEEVPLVYGKQVTSTCSEIDASHCTARCLDKSLVDQKVVLCDEIINTMAARAAGALGCILPDNGNNVSDIEALPVGALNKYDFNLVKTYQNSTEQPKVRIFKSEAINNPDAPLVALFSSRGPSNFLSDIIKPDVTAPGVEILGAYPPMASPFETSINYTILTGTSMACPHVAAAAAFVKSFHPDWSPSAIKSALMTTAWEMNPDRSLGAEFAFGSGHIYPHKAKDPGLVYNTSKEDYNKIWCSIFQSGNASCHANLTLRQLNHPSMAAEVDMKYAFVVSFPRTVTNVGKPNSKYVASIKGDTMLDITVDPDNLQFTALNQKKSFVVTIRGEGIKMPPKVVSMSLSWSDDIHLVRSPIIVYMMNSTASRQSSPPPRVNSTTSGQASPPPRMNSTASGQASPPPRISIKYVILFVFIIIAHCFI